MDPQLFNVLGIEVFVALKVKMLVFWSVELYSSMVRHRWFGNEHRPLSG
jgi:hypothetical protein